MKITRQAEGQKNPCRVGQGGGSKITEKSGGGTGTVCCTGFRV